MNKFLLALSITAMAASSALAQTSFSSIDVNQDGGITFVEASEAGLPWTQEQFSAADKDQSGSLDVNEFEAAIQ